MLAGGGWLGYQQYQFTQRAQRSQGRVVEIEQVISKSVDRNKRDSVSLYPVYEFSTPQGGIITLRASTGGNESPYQIGDSVEVLYDPIDPKNASIATFSQLWLGTMISSGLGILFIIISTIVFFLMRKAE